MRRGYAEYDALGRKVRAAFPTAASDLDDYVVPEGGAFTETVFDGLDRARVVVRPDGATTFLDYGPGFTEETNPRGYLTRSEFDWRGAVVYVKHFGDGDTSAAHFIERDGLGRVAGIEDADKTVRRYERDRGGRLRYATLPHEVGAAGLAFAYCYDGQDAVVSIVTPGGRRSEIAYDELGRNVATLSRMPGRSDVDSSRSYDDPDSAFGLGRLTRSVDGSGISAYDYDAFGRPAAVSRSLPSAFFGSDGVEFVASFAHDFLGNLDHVSLAAPSGPFSGEGALTVEYSRDSRGRATDLSSGVGEKAEQLVDSIAFDAANRLVAAGFGNGVDAAWGYDPGSQYLTSIEYNNGDTPVAMVGYLDRDENGNLKLEERFDRFGEIVSEKIHSYDALDRLDTSTLRHVLNDKDESYSYSPAGNVNAAGFDAYVYERGDLPQSVTRVEATRGASRTLTYDNDGHVTSDTWHPEETGMLQFPDQQRTFTWNAAGCLTSVLADNGGDLSTQTDLICDSAGNTVARKTTSFGSPVSSRFDIGRLGEVRVEEGIFLMRLPVGGTVQVEEAWSLETGERVVEESGYILSDARGSVLAKTRFDAGAIDDPTEDAVAEEAEYDAWGATARVGELNLPTHGFAGEEPDPVTGIYHFGVRSYDPSLRRWLSPDPQFLVSPQGDLAVGSQLNLYAYAGNNPVGNVDNAGTIFETIWDVASVVYDVGKIAVGAVTGDDELVEELGTSP